MTQDDISRLKEIAFDELCIVVINPTTQSSDVAMQMFLGMCRLIDAAEEDAIKKSEIIPAPDPIPEDCDNPCNICKYADKDSEDWPCADCIRGYGKVDYFKL